MQNNRKRLKKEDRREQIIQTACSLFAERGYDAISIKDIAQAIATTEQLVYQYFPNRNAIYMELFDRWAEEIKSPIRYDIVNSSALDTLRDIAVSEMNGDVLPGRKGYRNAALGKAIMSRNDTEELIHEAVLKGTDYVTSTIMPIVIFGQHTGEIRDGDPLDLASAFCAFTSGAWELHRRFGGRFHLPPADLCLDMLRKNPAT